MVKTRLANKNLFLEANVLRKLAQYPGIPTFYWVGTSGEYNVLVMELCGPPVTSLCSGLRAALSFQTLSRLTNQGLDILRWIHDKGLMHQNINPSKLMMGTG